MVITSKQVLPSGLVPITLIDIDVNYEAQLHRRTFARHQRRQP
jgi:hypothetical protein